MAIMIYATFSFQSVDDNLDFWYPGQVNDWKKAGSYRVKHGFHCYLHRFSDEFYKF